MSILWNIRRRLGRCALAPVTRAGIDAANAVLRRNPLQRFGYRVRTLDYLNLGCGNKMMRSTVNLNYTWYPGVDMTFDVRRRLPFPDRRFKGIYTEHVIEHLPPDRLPFVFSEWSRVLVPGGLVRVLVPDAELYVETYSRIRAGESISFPYPEDGFTPMMYLNQAFRDYGHLYAFDFETLSGMLRRAGFTEIRRCGHKEGRDPNLLLDSEERKIESLRIEAEWPA